MARACTLCTSDRRTEIDDALATGLETYRYMARRFGTSAASLQRHKTEHLAERMAKAEEARAVVEAAEGGTLLERLARAHRETWEILAEARKDKDRENALRALARVEKQLELEGKLIGELNGEITINVETSPEWVAIRSRFAAAARARPDVRELLLWVAVGGPMPQTALPQGGE